jgi:hypothetical protein
MIDSCYWTFYVSEGQFVYFQVVNFKWRIISIFFFFLGKFAFIMRLEAIKYNLSEQSVGLDDSMFTLLLISFLFFARA